MMDEQNTYLCFACSSPSSTLPSAVSALGIPAAAMGCSAATDDDDVDEG